MDPLSITASVAGLLAAAGKVYTLIQDAVGLRRDAPTILQEAGAEVRHFEMALCSLNRYLSRVGEIPAHRRRCIQLDDLTTVLADAVLTMSALEVTLNSLRPEHWSLLPSTWPERRKAIASQMASLQRQKSSMQLMLSIIQCESSLEVLNCEEQLIDCLQDAMGENKFLARRLNQLHCAFDTRRTLRYPDDDSSTIRPDAEEDPGIGPSARRLVVPPDSDFPRASPGSQPVWTQPFEPVLQASRVYRQARDSAECDRSFTSSAIQSSRWSALVGLSIADVSVLSVVALPISTADIRMSYHYTSPPAEEVREGSAEVGFVANQPEAPTGRRMFGRFGPATINQVVPAKRETLGPAPGVDWSPSRQRVKMGSRRRMSRLSGF